MKWLVVLLIAGGCGDNASGQQDAFALDAEGDAIGGDLFGEPCTQPAFPEIGICREGAGACHDEAGGSVCRPFCHVAGAPQCEARGGVETTTDRGACVCVPP